MERTITVGIEEARDILSPYAGPELDAALAKAQDSAWDVVDIVAKANAAGGTDISIQEPTGVMVAVILPRWVQPSVAIPGGTKCGDLHITLAYLGDAKGLNLNKQRALIGAVGQVCMSHAPLTGTLGGVGRFKGDGKSPEPFWVGVQVDGLQELRDDLVQALSDAGFTVDDKAAQLGQYTPHVTVAWLDPETPDLPLDFKPAYINIGELTVCIGPQRLDIELQDGDAGGENEVDPEYQGSGWAPTLVTKALDVDEEQRYTLGPWYPPNSLDAHGEWSDPKNVEKSFRDYMTLPDPHIRYQHNREIIAGTRVDGVVWPFEVTVPMTKADGTQEDVTFPAGTPFMGTVWEKWAWPLVKDGRITGYSIGGTAKRLLVDLPDGSVEKRYISTEDRKNIDDADFAGPNRSFPIEEPEDVAAAAHSLGRAKGDRDAIKAKIIAIARRKGKAYTDRLPDAWKSGSMEKRYIPASERQQHSTEDFAGPHNSFPIFKPEDVAAAAHALGRAKGDRDAIKARIIAIAKRKGSAFTAQLPDAWK